MLNLVSICTVLSIDGITSDWSCIPWDVLEKISAPIVNVNRVVYDIIAKPPATIE